VQKEPVLSRG